MDGRLFKQTIRLVDSNHKAVLLLEGTASDADRLGVRRESLQGALITITLMLGLPAYDLTSIRFLNISKPNILFTRRTLIQKGNQQIE